MVMAICMACFANHACEIATAAWHYALLYPYAACPNLLLYAACPNLLLYAP